MDDWTEEKAAKTRMRVKTPKNMLKINTDQSHNASSDDFVLYPLPGQRFSNLKASKSQKIPFEEKQ